MTELFNTQTIVRLFCSECESENKSLKIVFFNSFQMAFLDFRNNFTKLFQQRIEKYPGKPKFIYCTSNTYEDYM